MARINWTNVALDVRRKARPLVEDPEYLAALDRRLADGKAPRMRRLLLQWPDQKARDPDELRRGLPPLTVASKYLPWDPRGDPMREQSERMIAAKEREEEEARAQQAAPDKQVAVAPEEPEEGEPLNPFITRKSAKPPNPPNGTRNQPGATRADGPRSKPAQKEKPPGSTNPPPQTQTRHR